MHPQEMGEIAREHAAKNKVKSFALSETSTAALDLHLLNAVINDDTQIRAGSRLQLAVQWNRKEVVQSVMINLRNTAPGHDAATTENYVREQVAQALQMAIEREQADIIKMLLVQHEKAIGQLDFLSLYRQDHPLFATSAILTTKLAEGPALNASGKATSIALYKQVLLPFLRDFVPGIHYALAREQDKSATRVKNSRASLKATTTQYFEDGLPHLMLWAVFIGSVELARVFWQQSTKHSDPIRLALIASQASKEAAEVRPSAAQLYLRNADVFEGWAVSVLDKCPTHNKATIVLMRPSHIWPGTILQVGTACCCTLWTRAHRPVCAPCEKESGRLALSPRALDLALRRRPELTPSPCTPPHPQGGHARESQVICGPQVRPDPHR